MMKLSKQEQKIYNHFLQNGNKATVRELLPYTNYPTSKIRDMRKKGLLFGVEEVEGQNFIRYILQGENK